MGALAIEANRIGARLPVPRGPVSELVIGLLAGDARGLDDDPSLIEMLREPATEDALGGDDLHLALYLCYGLHYRSFAGVDDGWEWSPALLGLRRTLEAAFLGALRDRIIVEDVPPDRIGQFLFELEAADDGPSLADHLARRGTLDQFREFAVHRSAYQLKEADPHSWAIPRLRGAAKVALIEIQSDEYGGGSAPRMHSALFARTLRALDLDDREDAYLDRLPGVTLATVNLMSACGLRRDLRGAIVGHLAMFEMTSSRPNRRYGDGLRRLGLGQDAIAFYDEHVEADAVHENIAAYDLAEGLAREEPGLAADIVFGAKALLLLDRRFAEYLLAAWGEGRSSLRDPLGPGRV